MTRLGIVSLPTVLLMGLLGCFRVQAAIPGATPDFKEVYDLIREHLSEMNEAELNRVAVQSLISALSPRVSLAGGTTGDSNQSATLVTQTSLFDGPIAYVRVNQVGEGLDKALRQAWQELGTTNKLSGLVMDLRYAGGADYASAAAAADLFVRKEQPLLDWGQGVVRSKEKTDNFALPLAVLVNRRTTGAAEALAAMVRETGAGLILGGRTAGQAMIAQEYPLKDGERLRIATTPVLLGDGSALSADGIKPDIAVEVPAEDERVYYADAFKEPAKPAAPANPVLTANSQGQGTNRTRRPRLNEAELVRERRDGLVLDSDASGGGESEKPAVRDPVLGRALDFLKGLSVVRQSHS